MAEMRILPNVRMALQRRLEMDGFRQIPGYPNHWVCAEGDKVASVASGSIRYLSFYDFRGYKKVALSYGSECPSRAVHVLVALAWIGPRPTPKHQVRHLDGNPSNNSVTNLAYGTASENARDRIAHGRCKAAENSRKGVAKRSGSLHVNSKINEQAVSVIRLCAANGMATATLAGAFGLCVERIRDVIRGRSWKHVPLYASILRCNSSQEPCE